MFYSIATVSFLGAEHGSLRGGFSPDSSLRSALRSQRAEEVEGAPRLTFCLPSACGRARAPIARTAGSAQRTVYPRSRLGTSRKESGHKLQPPPRRPCSRRDLSGEKWIRTPSASRRCDGRGGGSAVNPAEPRFLAEVGAGVGWGAALESSRAGQLSTVPAPATGKKTRFSRGRSPFLEGAQSLAAGPPWRESRRGRSGDSGVRRGQWRCFSRLG